MVYTDMERAWIWLANVPGIGDTGFYRLLSAAGDAREVYDDPSIVRSLLSERQYKSLLEARGGTKLDDFFAAMEKCGVIAVTRVSDGYPECLTSITDPPSTLYMLGNTEIPQEKLFSVVGSRACTSEGRMTAHDFSKALAENGVTVVSGMAEGIDAAAAEGALDGHGSTVAVLGCGPDIVYPRINERLYRRILEEGGLILSEHPVGVGPQKGFFPRRNRIISGMSEGILIVEGDERSGARITANLALEQGKEVFAVPGSIYSPRSKTPNELIATGAYCALSAWDILETMRWGERPSKRTERKPAVQLTDDEQKIIDAVTAEALSYEELAEKTRLEAGVLSPLLTTLELRGLLTQLPGGLYRCFG